ncbi:hypothetical protein ARMA_3036 [Ardenticatena maritima]|uniref:Colicin V production protein n=1 Tax=Ardenticatena maritima TaxID=872965 RepID=A0A0M8K9L5_9CHLR|nr:hypothetical protein [Ardenticatena maritima]KPL87203.1 hypothetical protein SE16_11850 [Ardenticatena maritima]GAP64613.1 hypothetical protein ARMA_3036 [Ardenticatena maritima]
MNINIHLPTEVHLTVDFMILTYVSILFFALLGVVGGWKRTIATLAGISFGWLVALKSSDFLIRLIRFVLEVDFSGPRTGLFQIGLYVASMVMVVVTFHNIIERTRGDRRDKLISLSLGSVAGFLFMVLLLDLGRDWIAAHVNNWALSLNLGYNFDSTGAQTVITIDFLNNAVEVYERIGNGQVLILLAIVAIFWHGFLFSTIARLDKKLRSA